MGSTSDHKNPPKIQRNPQAKRAALINATLSVLAQDGITDTTVTKIVAQARLSRGLIHLHFGGKNALLAEAARCYADDYFDKLDTALAAANPDPRCTVETIIRTDLSPEVLNKETVAIWHGLRGGARNIPEIFEHSDTRDQRLRNQLRSAMAELFVGAPGDKPGFVSDACSGLLAMLEGFWTDYLLHPHEFNRDAAERIAIGYVTAMFPLRTS